MYTAVCGPHLFLTACHHPALPCMCRAGASVNSSQTCSSSSSSNTCAGSHTQPQHTTPEGETPRLPEDCPLKFASRLNSMQARRDLVGKQDSRTFTDNVLGWIARQGQVAWLDLVDLNYPQHFQGLKLKQVGWCKAVVQSGSMLSPCLLLRIYTVRSGPSCTELELYPTVVRAVCQCTHLPCSTRMGGPHTTH